MSSIIEYPHPKEKRIIFANAGKSDYTTDIETYLEHGGYQEAKKAFKMTPEEIIAEVKAANLRGRGGAAFPTGVKWSFIKRDDGKPHYLCVNADESEPGTFKDRYILHRDPHQLIEGMIISSYALNVNLAYIYVRCEFTYAREILEKALAEAYSKGYLGKKIFGTDFNLDIYVHEGAGAYICGEETSLLESLEGKRPYPRIKPPYFPAVLGLYMSPTIVNNVETICHVKHILRLGSKAYAEMGSPGDGGTRTLCVSGDVVRPGAFEMAVGSVTFGELINDICGGLRPGRKLKAIIPGGSSSKVLRADEVFTMKETQEDGSVVEKQVPLLECKIDVASLAAAGSMIGSAAIIIMDDSRNMVEVLNNINTFYAHESCGQCTPCREGVLWMSKVSDRIVAHQGEAKDPQMMKTIADNIAGRTVCAFGEAASWPTQSFLEKFPEEFAAAVNHS